MKLGVNGFLWTAAFGPQHVELLAKVKAWGFDGFEIPIFDPAALNAAAIRTALQQYGLEPLLCTILPAGLSCIDEDAQVRRRTVDHLASCAAFAAEIGAKRMAGPVYAPVGYLPGRRRTAAEWERAVECLRAVAPALRANDVTLAVEPLNRFETYFLNTAADAAALSEAVADRSVGVLLDTFHGNIEEKSLPAACTLLGAHLHHVHISENDRGIPGTGHVDFVSILDRLRALQYEGYLVIESFGSTVKEIATAAAIWRDLAPSADSIASEGVSYLRRLLAQGR